MVAAYGYLKMSRLGMGEDLPLGVYSDWRRWCSFPQYFFDDPTAEFTAEFGRVTVPVVAVNSSDDAWATPASADAFFRHYPTARQVSVTPADIGVRSIGHIQYVRPACRPLRSHLGAWLEERWRHTA
jgi:predicted alpha/beta hydrolase